jgi:CRISPR/Cas system CSM-associated protein Csm3 (group 7 of RAMP superfamily)
MRPYDQEPAEKPYDFVPFPNESPKRSEPFGQSRLRPQELTGWLEIELETLTPLQVASGRQDFVKAGNQEPIAALQASVRRRVSNGIARQAVIPGSSLKGAIRSLLEAISLSCVVAVGPQARPAVPKPLNRCNDPKKLCPACRLFGAQNYQGQVSLEDALVPPNNLILVSVPVLWTPARGNRGLPNRYLSRNEAKGRKFYYHAKYATGPDARIAIKTGARIPARVHFTNLTEADLGLLLSALGLNQDYRFPIKIGAAKPVGLGSVQVHLKAAQLLQGEQGVKATGRLGGHSGQGNRLEASDLETQVRKWTQTALEQKMVLKEQLDILSDVLRKEGLSDQAPSGLY